MYAIYWQFQWVKVQISHHARHTHTQEKESKKTETRIEMHFVKICIKCAPVTVCVHVDEQNGKLEEDIRLTKKTTKFHFIGIVDAQRSAQTKSYLHSIANKLQRIC